MIEVPAAVWRATLKTMRECGRGRNECVVYWIGPGESNAVDAAVHPEHLARPGYYEVEPSWFHRFWVDLDRTEHSVLAQVHTHGGCAFHSPTDDEGAIVQIPGFISLVLPGFAMGDDCLERAHVAKLNAKGDFADSSLRSEIKVS
jgi:hypothetical protein